VIAAPLPVADRLNQNVREHVGLEKKLVTVASRESKQTLLAIMFLFDN
jgi:hypothetical protein